MNPRERSSPPVLIRKKTASVPPSSQSTPTLPDLPAAAIRGARLLENPALYKAAEITEWE
jgi:hypothetical protein